MKYLGIYLAVINIITFVTYYIDKQKAKKNKWRISEATLLGMAAIGGVLGAYAGMKIFRHKTKHLKFTITVPVLGIVWIAILVFLLVK